MDVHVEAAAAASGQRLQDLWLRMGRRSKDARAAPVKYRIFALPLLLLFIRPIFDKKKYRLRGERASPLQNDNFKITMSD